MDKNLKIALILSATDKATAILNRAFTNTERRAKALGKASKEIGEIGNKALITGGVMTAFFAKTVSDARASEIAQKKLTLGFQTMGSTAQRAQQMIDFAGTQQFKWGIEDEEIEDVMGKLSTFRRAMNETAMRAGIFQRATQAAFDLQAKGFGDAQSNIVQLGKALQNPALGSMALARAGAINKEDLPVIKAIQAAKGVTAAQLFLLKAVEKQVKGTAEAMADPIKVMDLQWRETSEAIGRQLLPAVQKFAQKIADHLPKIIAWIESHKRLIIFVAKAGLGILAFGGAMKTISFVLGSVNTFFKLGGFVIKLFTGRLNVIARIAGPVVKAFEAIKYGLWLVRYTVVTSVIPALQAAGTAVVRFGATLLASPITWYIAAALALAGIVYLVVKNWSAVSGFFKKLWSGVVSVFKSAVKMALSIFMALTPIGWLIRYWTPITHFFGDLWEKVKGKFTAFVEWIKGLGARFLDAGKNIAISIGKGILAAAMWPINAVLKIVKKIRRFLPFSPAKEGPLRDIHRVRIMETVAESMSSRPLIEAWNGALSQFHGRMMQPAAIPVRSGGGQMQIHFNPEIHLHGAATASDAAQLTDKMKYEFIRMMDEYDRQKQRRAY